MTDIFISFWFYVFFSFYRLYSLAAITNSIIRIPNYYYELCHYRRSKMRHYTNISITLDINMKRQQELLQAGVTQFVGTEMPNK